MYYNNISTIVLFKNFEHHVRTKYIDIQYHFVCYYIKQKIIDLNYIYTKKQLIDALTKIININNFKKFCKKINLIDFI